MKGRNSDFFSKSARGRHITFLLEGGGRFSFRFDVSVDRACVLDVLCNGVAVVDADDDDGVAVDRLGVLDTLGNGGLSFFCLLTSAVLYIEATYKLNLEIELSHHVHPTTYFQRICQLYNWLSYQYRRC